jgi:drug/metabolite transporter (DMT)-like permease
VLALGSTLALNWGWLQQHGAVEQLQRFELRHPVRGLLSLFRSRRWLLGCATGLAGWALYIAALALAPLSLVQGVSAGGIGLLALLVQRMRGTRLERREWVAVAVAVGGLALLAASLVGGVGQGRDASTVAVLVWLAGAVVAVAVLAGPLSRVLAGGAGLGLAAGTLYAAGDVATKAAVGGHWPLVLAVLAAHGGAFVALMFAFQRGNALVTAGLNTLATNALPIVAGVLLFRESFPGGLAGGIRAFAFATTVIGAALLARGDPEPVVATELA